MVSKSTYNEQDIDVLKGLEPVQVRPGMYTTTENPNHIMQEVVDNAQDEALAGHATEISVELHDDGSVTVEDNGRGIPCGIHPSEKKPVIEVVFTHLHAGGKFKKGEGKTYGFTGGLHGVGVSVTNALSEKLDVTVFREGHEHSISFENGKVSSPLRKKKLDNAQKNKTGTRVRAYPNPKYFDNPTLHTASFEQYLRAKAVLLRGTKVIWRRPNKPEQVWQFVNGMEQYLTEQSADMQWFAPLFGVEEFYSSDNGSFEQGEGFELVVGWGDGSKSTRESYVNLIHTKEGGRHETGMRAGLLDAFRKVADRTGALPKNLKLEAEDVWSNISFVLSVKLMDPQFQNQTKDKMTSEKAHRLVSSLLSDKMELYLNDNPVYSKALLDVMVQSAIARSKQGAKIERRKSSSGLVLPGKLADCLGNDVNSSELFLVEGDSAAGCLSINNRIPLADGRVVDFLTLIEEDRQGKQNYCYTILKDGSVGVEKIIHPRLTKHGAEIIAVTLDNGSVLELTLDHRCMKRNGDYCRADQLVPGDSLMPLYKRITSQSSIHSFGKSKTMIGYEEVWDNKNSQWTYTHHLADLFNIRNGIYHGKANGKFARHHVDFVKTNNNPNNIVRMGWREHFDMHSQMCQKNLHTKEVFAKLRELKKTPEFRKFMSERMKRPETAKILSQNSKKLWENSEYKKFMTEAWRDFYNSNEEYRKTNKAQLFQAQLTYWSCEKNKEKQSERVSKFFKDNPNLRQKYSDLAKAQWGDVELKKWRAQETSKQWANDDFRKKRDAWQKEFYFNATLPVLRSVWEKNANLDPAVYEDVRKKKGDRRVMKLEKFVTKYFNGDMDLCMDAIKNHNHKVVSVEKMAGWHDVYDIEVPESHNFALESGVFVHNSGKSARDKETQAILPLRGKLLNTWEVDHHKLMSSEGVANIASAVGVDPHSWEEMDKVDLSKLRYGKVFIMADADVDGQHIQVLLLTLFVKHFPALIKNGHIWIAQAPLFRIDAPAKKGAKGGPRKMYALDDDERESMIALLEREGLKEGQYSVSRFKGLGEMNPDQLGETTMNKETRRALKITLSDIKGITQTFDRMMGSKNAKQRKDWMEESGADIEID